MRVLITGANGLLGQKLTNLLSQEDVAEVHATGRGPNRNVPGNYSYHTVDLKSESEVAALFGRLKPEAVIHTAAMTHVDECETNPDECREQNVSIVKTLVRQCRKSSSFLTHLSTDFIFDGVSGPYDEESIPAPLSVYGQSKLDAEKIILSSSVKAGIARTVLVYGQVHDMSRSNLVLWVKKSLEEGKSINLITDQYRMPTLAEDLAMGCWLITKGKHEGVFNISGKDYLNPYEMALQVAEVFDLDASLISPTDGSRFTQPAKRPPKTELILDKAIGELGYQPHSFKEGLALLKSQIL